MRIKEVEIRICYPAWLEKPIETTLKEASGLIEEVLKSHYGAEKVEISREKVFFAPLGKGAFLVEIKAGSPLDYIRVAEVIVAYLSAAKVDYEPFPLVMFSPIDDG